MVKKSYNPLKMWGFWIGLLLLPVLIFGEFLLDNNPQRLQENFNALNFGLIFVFALSGWIINSAGRYSN